MSRAASLFVSGQWRDGQGATFKSLDPATGEELWEGHAATAADVDAAVEAARAAQPPWSKRAITERVAILDRFTEILDRRSQGLAEAIARETGKVLWDSKGELAAMANKLAVSKAAYEERTGIREQESNSVRSRVHHRAHGVLAVFGPFNFPCHLPNGHIMPALLAGNTIVLKPSEKTPMVTERMVGIWEEAGLPPGVLNLVQGAAETGRALVRHPDINGVLFTGSAAVGQAIAKELAERTGTILALELGGNNPLLVHRVDDQDAAALLTVQSAFLTTGQRCTCARRLIVPSGNDGDRFLKRLAEAMDGIAIGSWSQRPEPFMGPLITSRAAEAVSHAQSTLLERGGVALRQAQAQPDLGPAYVSPGLIDVTDNPDRSDAEIFGPLLQVIRTPDFESALVEANRTRYGLTASLLSDDENVYHSYYSRIRAGIVNWNRPTTGALSTAPFGGIGLSGNLRPGGYYAADFCAYPVASLEAQSGRVENPAQLQGVTL